MFQNTIFITHFIFYDNSILNGRLESVHCICEFIVGVLKSRTFSEKGAISSGNKNLELKDLNRLLLNMSLK
jgi:hypothetical protein